MSGSTHTLMIEGWRFIPHSYAIVNQFQCLQIIRHPEIRLAHRDIPYYNPNWQPVSGLFDSASEAAIRAIPAAATDERPDTLLRVTFPYNFASSPARRTFIYGTAEYACVPRGYLIGASSLGQLMLDTDFTIITPSNWSRRGFIRSGAHPDRVVVIPHGIDPAIFQPLPDDRRAALRAQFGWNGFVFLSLGAMTDNKGIPLLLKNFAIVAKRHPEVRLVLKGLDALYPSRDMLRHGANALTPAEVEIVQPRLIWMGHTMGFADMARLYQAADAYISPYRAEGFNMPVLEAAASGTLVICTRGGATDDFTTADFTLHVDSRVEEFEQEPGCAGSVLHPDGEHLLHQMFTAIQRPELRAKARQAGPAFASSRFTWKSVVDQLLSVLFPER